MKLLVVAAAVAAWLLPARGLRLWNSNNDYINFLVMKSCLGMDVALKLEKVSYEVGQSCEQNDEDLIDSIIDLLTNEPQNRRRRAIVKLPRITSPAMVLCNLHYLKLLTDNKKVNYTMVEEELRKLKIDKELKKDLQDTLTLCRIRQQPSQDLFPKGSVPDALDAMISAMNYLQCLTAEGLQTCVRHEKQRYASKFNPSPPLVT